jgi:hypothetical protein
MPFCAVADDPSIERVSFDRFPACFSDQAVQVLDRDTLGSFGTSIVVNQLVDDRAIEVVCSETECRLSYLLAEHDPVSLDVVEVVEHQSRDSDGLQISHPAGLGDVIQAGVVRVKRERNKCLKSARFVLQFAELAEMIDAVLRLFDVSVKHRRIGSQPQLMRVPVNVDPGLRIRLVLADLRPDFLVEDLRTAAGHAAQSGLNELLKAPFIRLFREVTEPVDLNSSPGLDVQLGARFVDDPHDVNVPLERFLVVQSADNVDFRRPLGTCFQSPFADHVVGKRVSFFGLQVRPERTENAAINADIRRVQMNVRVVVREVSVLAFPHGIRQLAERQHVDLLVEKKAFVERQPLADVDLLFDDRQLRFKVARHDSCIRENYPKTASSGFRVAA